MDYTEISYAVADGIATVTLNRPDKLNAWTRVMEGEVRAAMTAAANDEAVRVVVLTGAGRGFCAGADMNLLADTSAAGADTRPQDHAPGAIAGGLDLPPDFSLRYAYFPTVPKPIIAAINGPCAGLGLIMALYCDVRFAATDAVFTTAFARRGLIAEHGISWLLPALVGHANALDLLLSARKLNAGEAHRIGLVNHLAAADALIDQVMAYARDLADNVSPRSIRVMKRQVYRAVQQSLEDAILIGNAEMPGSFASEDFREGVAHFVEKRPARFSGR
ncbi:MAG: enoyl-CoA hydratase [Gammaproteobacteria bacterium]|nr:enoyl-CoA hydratase [Gammaproteobacteria bacterium]MCP5201264.1 enoyl-CoA hydratase [Gammaproteobacteria bacterium]